MMDCVWVYKSVGLQQELEWSIKSVKNIEHQNKYIVGDKPIFETDAIHIKPPIVRMAMLSPHHDVINKLNYTTSLDISDDFILLNDDFFCMKPSSIPIAHRGKLEDHFNNRRINDAYTKTLKKTLDYLKSIGIDEPLSYELHIPMVFNKEKLSQLYATIIPMITHNSPMLTRSLYGNIYNIGGAYMDDVKNVDNFEAHNFLSTNETTFNSSIGNYIRSKL